MKSMATDYGAATGGASANRAPGRSVLVVAGPTGGGKSALAVDLARAHDGVVINADSMQVYRELRVLTARPTTAEEATVPHRLYGVLPAAERCSAGRWLRMALPEIEAAFAQGKVPVVVGGTGLYLRALIQGLADIPDIPATDVARAGALYDERGGEAFRADLRALDPDAADRLPASDRQRLIRAYAVVKATGRTLKDWHREGAANAVAARFATIVLTPPTDVLYPILDARFDAMMAAGGLDEARAFAALGVDPSLPAAKAVGVRELLAHLAGDLDLEAAVAKAKQATRNFAKRQRTWLRHQVRPDVSIESIYDSKAWAIADGFAGRFLSAQFSESL